MKQKLKQLKDYSINTKIIIREHRERYTDRKGMYKQPFVYYSYQIFLPTVIKSSGGFKNTKELFKSIEREF